MKKEFPKYGSKELDKIFEKLKPKDRATIDKLVIFTGTTAGKATNRKYKRNMIKIADIMQCGLTNITLDREREFLNILKNSELAPPTKNEVRKVLKRILKELYPDWNVRFKGLKDIRLEKEKNEDKLNDNTILKPNHCDALIRGTNNLKMKAMISLFAETGARPEEIMKLKWKDITLD